VSTTMRDLEDRGAEVVESWKTRLEELNWRFHRNVREPVRQLVLSGIRDSLAVSADVEAKAFGVIRLGAHSASSGVRTAVKVVRHPTDAFHDGLFWLRVKVM
jgi:hypothetical protein